MRVVIADDSLLFREGVVRLLQAKGVAVVAQVGDASQLTDAVAAEKPDVAIIDIRMPPTFTNEGILAAMDLRRRSGTHVLVLSHHVESTHAAQLLAGNPHGVGYLLKDRVTDLDEFVDALRRVAAGGSAIDPDVIAGLLSRQRIHDPLASLTPRERDILALMAEGRSNPGIGSRLFLTLKTVETHVARIFAKLGLPPATTDNRRVLAVITYLRANAGPPN